MGKSPIYDKSGLKKGPWTPEEDAKLIDYIGKHGHGRWKTVPKSAGLDRCGKSCRLRWTNYLRPDIKRGRFTFEEEETIIQLHSVLGNKWSAIAARLPGRTDNEIKNYWNTHIRKRLLRSGIDPVTHTPRLDLLQLYSILNSCLSSSTQPNQNLTGIPQPSLIVNPNLLNVVTSLLSSQCKPLQSLPQNLYAQNHFQKTSNPSVPEQYTHELMQTSREGEDAARSSLLALPYLYQQFPGVAQDRDMINSSNHSLVGLLSGEQILRSMNDNNKSSDFVFGSAISMPSSKSTTGHSSTTFLSASTEEERDSYCSMLEIPKNIDIDSLM